MIVAEMTVIEPVAGESHNLELHTELCAQRYNQLIAKFDEVDGRLTKIESMLTDIHHQVSGLNTQRYKTYLVWAGVVITTLLTFAAGLVGHIVTG
jgi:hypothetical protein